MFGLRTILAATATVFALAGGVVTPPAANAQEKASFLYPINRTDERVAIDGYDLVAYFKEKKAMKGDPQHAVKYGDTIYYFANEAHQNAFLKHPTKYMPRFGGFCPVRMSEGKAVQGDPTEFVVRDGNLYLCADDAAHETFSGDPKAIVHQAEQNAPSAIKDYSRRGR